ncbi:hypothetical protein [Photobacterium sanguinicancri]|uniref:Uncharacterized protein n=1 Tax=Photobacterium sanguinicancri TaxID=875932 RepID=A0AAW7Y9G7_9GAMM|nr:hypothetical protein [Photobacterium sanguinicancri]MDO6544974.1 hypothetical protein [Photobacterium sanguinicancri]
MDIERFSPHCATATPPTAIAPLPSTVEMTGFSGQRHYLEQHIALTQMPHRQSNVQWSPPLDSLH